jgi:2-amino-4-hydroxy-6-hydroxymethyldihydropteridine diphosphokinase
MTKGNRSGEAAIVIYLGLGSNVGDREANLREAMRRIDALGLDVAAASSIYETEPVGYRSQPWFLNQVLEVRPTARLTLGQDEALAAALRSSTGAPLTIAPVWTHELLKALIRVEREMGRERSFADGPRAIDIDLLLVGDFKIKTEGFWAETMGAGEARAVTIPGARDLVVPHPRMHLRRFVLEPLCEIAPELAHPVLKKTCREMLASLNDASVVRLYRRTGG